MKKIVIPLALLCAALSVPSVASAGWTSIPVAPALAPYASARACKTSEGGAFGPVWRINYQVFRNNTLVTAMQATTYRYNSNPPAFVNSGYNNNWLFGTVAGTGGAVGSQLFDDRYFFTVFSTLGTSTAGPILPSQIANC
jgi:hypothetical protein